MGEGLVEVGEEAAGGWWLVGFGLVDRKGGREGGRYNWFVVFVN